MRKSFVFVFLLLLAPLSILAQEPTTTHPISLTAPEKFWTDYFETSVPQKTEFQTEKQYKELLPKYSGGAQYFVVEPNLSFKPVIEREKGFTYDVKKKKLTLRAGGAGMVHDFLQRDDGINVVIKTVIKPFEPYEIKNGFGVKVMISGANYDQFLLQLHGAKQFSHLKGKRFEYTIENIEPDKAEELAKEAEFIIKVTPHDYHEKFQFTATPEPVTFEHPYKHEAHCWGIHADLQQLIVRRKSTGEILLSVSPSDLYATHRI